MQIIFHKNYLTPTYIYINYITSKAKRLSNYTENPIKCNALILSLFYNFFLSIQDTKLKNFIIKNRALSLLIYILLFCIYISLYIYYFN